MTTNDIDAIRKPLGMPQLACEQKDAHPEHIYTSEKSGARYWCEPGASRPTVWRDESPQLRAKVAELTAELAKAREQLTAANRRADGLQADLNSAQRGLTEYANENNRLKPVANAARRVTTATGLDWPDGFDANRIQGEALTALTEAVTQLDGGLTYGPTTEKAEAAEQQYLIWSQHHQSWWGPSRSGYRSNPDDAGRYTLAAAQAEMGRGCYCCQVPEVPVAAGEAIGRGDRAIQAAIGEAIGVAIAEGRGNTAYEKAEATR
ncbi:hypothetical protein AB0J14_38585 [Micromonospora arborensis]|uniref:hypothetical protein n=1 Tax=Micromonospora arborensis TaxID=2116518 RepID=UPI0034017012